MIEISFFFLYSLSTLVQEKEQKDRHPLLLSVCRSLFCSPGAKRSNTNTEQGVNHWGETFI